METLAYIVFYSCIAATLLATLAFAGHLASKARRGDVPAQLVLSCLGAMLIFVGFGWSTDYLWGPK